MWQDSVYKDEIAEAEIVKTNNLFYKHNKYLMKKNVLRIILAGFLFAGITLVGGSNMLQAQSAPSYLFDPPTGTFVSKEVALERLDLAIVPHKNIMEAFPPLSPEHKQAFRKYSYFNAIINLLIDGKTIPEAISEGMTLISTDAYNIPSKQLPALRQEAIELLRP